jgi:hypothetical protein
VKEVGIVFCSEQNDAMARVTPPENDEQILAAERALRLATNVKGPSDGKG